MMTSTRKEDCIMYEEDLITKKAIYTCKICFRKLASKQNMMLHLFNAHNMSPVKKIRKQYLENPSLSVPKRTFFRWKRKKKFLEEEHEEMMPSSDNSSELDTTSNDVSEERIQCLKDITMDTTLSNLDEQYEHTQDSNVNWNEFEDSPFPSDQDDSFYEETDSCVSSDDFSDASGPFIDSDAEISVPSSELKAEESSELAVLACFLRNNLSISTSKDIITTLQKNYTDSQSLQSLNYEKIWQNVLIEDSIKEVHYCLDCNNLFPCDVDIFNCQTPDCNGLRYKGSQQRKGRQPVTSFMIADVRKQLKALLKSQGIWEDIKKNKRNAYDACTSNTVKDITSGLHYKQLMMEGRFLHGRNNTNITAVINTDGINLYSSSKVELWPIFLAINELSPEKRFARENMLLAGIWQGKGKPPFYQYMKEFSNVMNELYNEGVFLEELELHVRLAVICCTADLPAKAGILNMTLFNGAESCIVCEDPGKVVKQGKGHARCFPFRPLESAYATRSHDEILECMKKGTPYRRCKGFKGESGLVNLESLQLPAAMVPDYMHGILLGTTKTLMYKWFSSTESKREYFVGNKLKEISKRLQKITPPDSIERLPRNLETSYTHFKATEYQTWLLFYCLPCLSGILPEKYIDHFSLLSEAVHILLGDNISSIDLAKAGEMLTKFYQQFAMLYPEGSCGLNVHNIGAHLVFFVKEFGPLWAWSCFGFEDSNAMILQAVHGTGNVMKQVLRLKEAQGLLRSLNRKEVKPLQRVANCEVAGAVQQLGEDDYTLIIKDQLLVHNLENFKKFSRCVVNGKKFFSMSYTRMKRRQCYVVMKTNGSVIAICYFLLTNTNVAYAAVREFEISRQASLAEAGSHLVPVQEMDNRCIIPVEDLRETLIYIKTTSANSAYVARLPNQHGRAVFK